MSHIIGVKWVNNNNKKNIPWKIVSWKDWTKNKRKSSECPEKNCVCSRTYKKKIYKISSLEEKFKTLKAGLRLLNSVSSVLLLDILDTSIAHIPSFSHYMFGYALS